MAYGNVGAGPGLSVVLPFVAPDGGGGSLESGSILCTTTRHSASKPTVTDGWVPVPRPTVTDAAIGWVSRHLPVTGSLPSWPTTDPTLTGSAILPTLTTTVAPGTGDVAAPDRPTASPTATTAGITARSNPFFRVV